MLEELDLTNMPIITVLRDWMISEDWKDEIEISEDGNNATVSTIYLINDQDHRLYLETDEKSDEFAIFLYSPFNIPVARRSEILDVLNRVHGKMRLGRFCCPTGEKARELQFKVVIDVEGSSISTKQIDVMLGSALNGFRSYGPVFARVAMTNEPAETAWSDFEAAQKSMQEDDEEELGPMQL
jgi:hypothetical protein